MLPPFSMGGNSWTMQGATVKAKVIEQTAEAFVERGLKDAGREIIVIDDHWHGGYAANGRLFPDRQQSPGDMKALADHLHAGGFPMGVMP
ncbi:MAG: hypothetical protein JXB85_03505 [Anaerolineales bacterium]|nr:hypothetical protein [Anaerolineales bacterium]